jgi:YbgC/YbaW family acyl-CoA thioester hydrolase
MTLHLRIAQSILSGIKQPKLPTLNIAVALDFRVLPTDLDSYRHMNNAIYLNYMEAVRWSFMARTGLLKLALKNGWIAPIAKIEIQYVRPLKLMQKFAVDVRLIKTEEKWFYLYQEFRCNGKIAARALVKSTLRSKNAQQNIPPSAYLPGCGYSESDITTPELLKPWLDSFSGVGA